MAIYAELFDGTRLEFPDGTDQEVIDRVAKEETLKRRPKVSPPEPKESTIASEAMRGARQFISTARTGVGAGIGSPEEAARAGLERAEKIEAEAGEGPSLERIQRVYRERGLLPAAGQVASDIPRFLAQQAPQIGATIAGAKLGAMAGSAIAPGPGTLIGAGLGAIGANVPSTLGSAVQRQAATQIEEGKPVDISMGRAAAATAGSAALEAAGTAGVLGKNLVKRLLGVGDDAALAAARSKEDLVKAARATITGGAIRGAAVEMPVEVAQSVLDRWQAGLDVTGDDALKEYGESLYAAGLVGGPIGGASAIPTRRAAQRALEEQEPLAPGQRRGETLEQTANRLNTEVQGLTGQLQPPPPSPFLSSEQLASIAASENGFGKLVQYEEKIKQEPSSPERNASLQASREFRQRLEIEEQQRTAAPKKDYPFDPYAPEPFQFKSSTELVDLINKIDDPADKLTRILEYRAEVKAQQASAERNQALKDSSALYDEINAFAQTRGFPAPKPFILQINDLTAAGIDRKDPLFEQLKGKDINKPDDVDTVVELTENAQRRTNITPELFDRLEGLLTSVEAHIRDKPGSGFYGQRTYPKPSGTGAAVAGQPKPTVPTGGVKPSGGMGLVGPTATAAPTVSRETAPPAPVVQKLALAETFPPKSETAFEPGLEIGEPAPDPELLADVKKLEAAREKIQKPRVLPKGQIFSLLSAVKGRLTISDTLDVSPDKNMRLLTAKSNGTFISELVNNSVLDKWLPPDKRPESNTYDIQESEEYIKDLLRNRDHAPYAVKEKLDQLNLQIQNLDDAIEQEKQLDILIRQTNAELQAASEERRAEEAELPAAEREAGDTVRAEKPAARARLGKPEPFTIDVEARVIEETVGPQVAKLPASQVALLENHYGEKAGTQSFLNKVKEDVVLFANKGASAVAEAIRAVIKAIHAGVISVSLIFNPINISQPEAFLIVPKAEAKTETVKPAEAPEVAKPKAAKLAQVPDNVEGMSDAARQAYQLLIPSLKDTIGDKLIVIADKPSARLFVFTPDGNLVVQNKALFGAAKGDLYNGNVNVPSNRITPAGLFGLKLIDAKTSPSAKRTAGEYDFGKVFALEDPEAVITIMHSVWLKESDASMRQAALRSPDVTDARYSYGCINVDQATFKYLLDNHERQMDGAKMFVVPDNQSQLKEFLYGDIAKNIGGLKPGEGPDRLVREAVKRMSLAKVAPQVSEKKFQELERRAKQPSKPEPAKEEPEEVKAIRAERAEKIDQLQGVLEKILAKYGLRDVKLNLEEGMKDEGSYEGQLIKLALDLDNPVRTLRHEAIHALKELGFFTPAQWKVLTDRAKSEWIEKYLKNQSAVVDGKEVTRYDAYMDLYKGDQNKIIEEAIADAFGDFSKTKPPPGMMQAILKRMENLFKAIKQALNQNGYQTAEDVFGKIEEGKLTKAEKLVQKVEAGAKPSIRSIETVPLSSRVFMEANPLFAMNELGLKTEGEKKPGGIFLFNNVRSIAEALNRDTLNNYGQIIQADTTANARKLIADAIADEVAYQVNTTSTTGTGLGWYSNNYPNAIRTLARKFPELGANPHARSVFSALVAITSNGEKVALNIKNAIGLYEKLRVGEPLIAPGSRRASALENNLQVIQDLLAEHKTNFKNVLLQEISVKDMNAALRAKGEEPSGDYLVSTKIPAAAIYFGPKLGAFYANLEGAEGYLTMDMWWTRSINRMRGLLIPQPTEQSINKFREIAGNPNMTREEIINASIPIRDQYEALDYTTDLEHMVGAKEPAKKLEKPAWIASAKRRAGPAYEQLKLEHDVMKMANTIYKNQYEMLAEAPFGANDREFMYRATRDAQKSLKQNGIDLTLADIQAALWYYEKRLYQQLSGRKADDIGYDEAISALARESDRPARPSVVFDIGVDSGAISGASVENIARIRSQRDEERGEVDIRKSLRAPDTKEFKVFFGESKIVDKDGEPKVMYHGTARDITSFIPKQAGAIFVTDDPDFAETFSQMSADWMAKHADQFLSPEQLKAGREAAIKQIKKDYKADPKFRDKLLAALDDPKSMYATDANEILAEQYKDQLPTGPNIMPVFVRAENPFDFDNREHIRQLEQYEAENRYTPNSISDKLGSVEIGSWAAIEDRLVQQAIKQLGFDGFYVKEGGKKNLAVYSSNQLKSAIGNIGTFDVADPDIRKSLRTLPTLPTDVTDRIKQTVIPRERPGMVGRLLDAISPRTFSKFREEFVNGYDVLARFDRQAAEQIRLMGGTEQLADAKAESAAHFADLGGGLAASAMGVNDRNGGIPVYVRKYVVEKDFKKIGPDYTTKAAAEAAAKKVGGQVFEQGYTTISNANGVKGLIAIFSDLAKYKKPAENEPSVFDQYQFWADVKRASRFIQNPTTGGYQEKLFNDPDDIKRAKQIEQAFPEFVDIQKEWTKYNDGLVDFMRDTGVISEAGAKEMKKHGDYFPFYRHLGEDDIQGPRLFSSIANVKSVKAAKGSEAPVTDFFETVVRNTQSAIQSGIKNVAARRATDQAMRIGEVFKLNRAESGPSVYRVLEDGKETYYQAQDPSFIDALKVLSQPDLPFIDFLALPARLLRNLVTKDPAFQLANMMRDSLSAYVSSGYKFTPMVATLKQYGTIIAGKSPEFEALLRGGVIGGYDYSRGVEASAAKLEKEMRKVAGAKTAMEKLATPFTSIWEALEKSSTASDAATRNEIYKKVLAETGNEAEALYQALEVMNFNRKGRSPIIRILTAAVPFMNARIQGLDVLYRSGMRPIFGKDATQQEKARLKTFWVRGMTMMALSSMYWMLTSDDEEYKKQEQEVRDNYWLFPSLGIKIPIPFEVGVMFKVVPERILESAFGSDTGKDFTKAMGRHLLSTFAFNPIPQTILPAVEVVFNRSSHTMRPIVSAGMENVAAEYQIGPNTSKIAGAIGQSLGISPIQLDYLIQGYTGTMGMYAVNLFDSIFSMNDEAPKPSRRLEQMPVLRRFMVDPEARGQITAYYDLKNSVDQVVRTSNYLERSMDFEQYGKYMQENIKMLSAREYINDLEKTMKEFREMKNLIRISKIDADQKRDSLTNIGRIEQQLTQNIKTLKKQLAAQQ